MADYDEIRKEAQEAYSEVREEAGEVIQEVKAAATGQPLDTANVVGGAGYRAPEQQNNGLAIASLVLGILSIVGAFVSVPFGLIFGIVGTVLGAKARKEAQTGMATGGFICSIIGLALSAVVLVCAVIAGAAACSMGAFY